MKLYLKGHEYKYAGEQILLMLFPEHRPIYPEAPPVAGEDFAEIALSYGKTYVTATTRLNYHGQRETGQARVPLGELTDKLVTDRLLQKIIKLSFYKAAVKCTGQHPAWGALTGIRPGTIVTHLLEEGVSPRRADRILQDTYYVSPRRSALCLDTAAAGLKVKHSLSPEEICLYVGIPFCPTRCAYCSFVSQSVHKSIHLIEPFLEVLSREIDSVAKTARELGLKVISVYIGGGTPTTLSPEQLASLIRKLRAAFDLSHVREFTVEAGRPDTITLEKLQVLKTLGVTRVSINPQSMEDSVLSAIGRKHTAADIVSAFSMARDVGIPHINMDLIAGLPTDTPAGFRRTLDTVLSLNPDNITVHTLSLKKGTKITLGKTPIPDGGAVFSMLDYGESALRGAGFVPYYLYRQKFMAGGFENVGWSRPGAESLYNICIMEELCSILAMGGGGSTKLVAPEKGKIQRVFNAKYPAEYIERGDKFAANREKILAFYRNEVFSCHTL